MEIELVGVRNDRYNVFVIKDDAYIGPCIARGYEWDGWMRTDVEKYYKPETDILDIGANIGYNTLMFSDYGPVHSFEPVYGQIVNKNCQSNALRHKVSVYRCARLDDVYKGTPSVVKIDVEGHELEVLEGAKETLEKHKPMILIELLPHIENSKKARAFLEELGYTETEERPESVYVFTYTSS